MAETPMIRVQVCYATPEREVLRDLDLPAGTSLHEAIRDSGILEDCPEIDLSVCRVGIYGKLKTLDTPLRERDRVEIYRALVADPKESRRKRAGRKAA
jgi:putative ubiquitin-RnfH superfamily antitoxin RatB of RatAB toxin-antitoxin module